MAHLASDLRYALRALRKNPAFAAASIIVMALGIGANTAIFSVVNAVLLRPLPFRDPNQLVQVWHVPPQKAFPGMTQFSVSPANFFDWKQMNHVFTDMAITGYKGFTLSGVDRPEALTAAVVSSNFFSVVGAQPMLGRPFSAEEDQPGRDHEIILSHAMWRDRYGSDKNIVGRQIELSGQQYSVVGVMGPNFSYPAFAEIWSPIALSDEERATRGIHDYMAVARLKPGATVEQANAELATISHALATQYPTDNKDWGAMAIPLRQELTGDVKPALLMLLGAVVFVLLIACANVANLLLARVLAKKHEIAVRVALGAGRWRLLQQILSESVTVSFLGGLLGLVFAHFGIRLLVGFLGANLPRATEIGLDAPVLVFTLIVSIFTGVAAGLLPAWKFAGSNASEGLKQGGTRSGAEGGTSRARVALVIAEVALSLMLLVGAGLMVRTLSNLQNIDTGFEKRQTLTMNIGFSENSYSTHIAQMQAVEQMLQNVRGLPGVQASGMIDSMPLTGGSHQPIQAEGQPVVPMSEQPEFAVRMITPGYMQSMRIPLLKGRDFSSADSANAPAAVLISASMAKQLFPNGDAVGKHVTLTFVPDKVREVVGVVGDVKQESLTSNSSQPSLYYPLAQRESPKGEKWSPRAMWLVVRTQGNPADIAPSVINAVHQVDSRSPIVDVFTVENLIGQLLQRRRMNMTLLVAFASLALILAAVGIYSVLAYNVRRRSREIGIRLALGAQIGDIIRLVLLQGMKPVFAGLLIGLSLALAMGRTVASLVYGVKTADVTTLVSVSAILMVVSMFASFLPAYRATKVHPVEVLRQD